ncbi:ORF6N domain-containing protein, partial [Morganella morganii]|uniref:ORF6N domain-containing protein n=1 Tax=Morganella morganii TaxID=582 RepID=UPI0034E523C2
MKNKLTTIDATALPVIEWKGVRVVTTETLAAGYGVDETNIRMNLSNNRGRFIEGVHVITLKSDDLKQFRNQVKDIYSVNKHTTSLTLWTEKGAARMSKIVDSDEAWSFFEKMEDAYFRPAP